MLSVCWGKERERGGERRTETKQWTPERSPKDKEKNGVRQKLSEIEGMTEIRSELTEGRDERQWWERNDLGQGKRRDERRRRKRKMRGEEKVNEGESKGREA